METFGVRDIIVVIGYMGYTIVDALGDGSKQGVSIKYVEQSDTLGIAHAVGHLEEYIDSPFMLFLGDIYFVIDDLRPMISDVVSGKANAYVISKTEDDLEMIKRNFAIIESEPGRVKQVIEKPRYVRNHIKGCGLYIFDQHIFDAIRRTPRTAMRDEYEITDSIQIMINDGHTVCHKTAVKYDMNLTVPEDLLAINLMDLRRRGLENLVGQRTHVPEGTVIENSVIGDDAVIRHPITIKNSLVFQGACVEGSSTRNNVIIHQNGVVHC
jgi:dTDP-glucose pyrophosphorylase